MDDVYQHPVFFECHGLHTEHKRKIEMYFCNRRRSGGGECGSLKTVKQNVYSIAFKHQRDQQRVLGRSIHELADGSLVFTIRDGVDTQPSSTSQEFTESAKSSQSFPASCPPSSGEEYEFQRDAFLLCYLHECPKALNKLQEELKTVFCSAQIYPEEEKVLVRYLAHPDAADEGRNWKSEVDKIFDGYQCHYEVDPHKVKALLQSCSSTQTTDEVKVYSEGGMAVVVGERSQVDARLMDVEDSTVKLPGSRLRKKQTSIHQLGEAKLCLLRKEIKQNLGQDFPGVNVIQGDAGQLVLEGYVEEVLEALAWVSEKEKLVLERTISDISSQLLTFLTKAYGGPGMLGDILGVCDEVVIELRHAELNFFSLSADKLDDTQKTLQSRFKEIKIDVPYCSTVPSELQEMLKSKTNEINQGQCKVQVVFSGSTVYLLGHTKEVEELSEIVTQFILDQSTEQNTFHLQEYYKSTRDLGRLSLSEGNILVASYSLCEELQVLVCQGDITKQEADALVNAANEDLDHCGGVAAALSKAGGPEVQEESKALVKQTGKVAIGDVVVTTGGKLSCRKLLHAVGPVGGNSGGREKLLLEKTVKSALDLAEMMEFNSIAMPCIGSGASGVPVTVCAEAIATVVKEFGSQRGRSLSTIILIDNRGEVVRAMSEACDRLLQGIGASTPSAQGIIQSKKIDTCVQKGFTNDIHKPDQVSTAKRIVLLGKTGVGKSSLANTIFKEELFSTNHTPNSGTKVCQAETRLVNERNITLIDTPGLFDSEMSEEELKPEIVRCITECAPGPHAFLIVLKVETYTEQEKAVIDKICEYFSEDALKYAVIVFTHGNQLPKKMKIKDFVSQNKNLSDLVEKCGGRCHVFDNIYWKNNQQNNYRSNQFQVEELLSTIDKMVMENNGGYYTNMMLQVVEEEIKKEEEQIKQLSGSMQLDKIRKQAKTTVSNRLLVELTGTATGALLGAFFGFALMVGIDVTAVDSVMGLIKLIKSSRRIVKTAATLDATAQVTTAAIAVRGGVIGGFIGHKAAEGAETVPEAAVRAYKAVTERRQTFN